MAGPHRHHSMRVQIERFVEESQRQPRRLHAVALSRRRECRATHPRALTGHGTVPEPRRAAASAGVLAVVGALTLVLAGSRGLVSAQVISVYLDGEHHGPYRGRVVDAETLQPLPGTVVVAIWRREIVCPLQTNTTGSRVRETLTGEDGSFLREARDIEEAAPRRTLRPVFLFFKPGSSVFKGWNDFAFEGAGTTMPLRKLASRNERRPAGNDVHPHSLSEAPFDDLPLLMRAVNGEAILRGIPPYPREKSTL